jgi:hypothetical protein
MKIWTMDESAEILFLSLAAPLRRLNISPLYYYVGLAILIVLLVVAAVKTYSVLQEIQDVEEPDSPSDLLETFEQARAAGEIDDAELARVRERLGYPAKPTSAKKAPGKPLE